MVLKNTCEFFIIFTQQKNHFPYKKITAGIGKDLKQKELITRWCNKKESFKKYAYQTKLYVGIKNSIVTIPSIYIIFLNTC